MFLLGHVGTTVACAHAAKPEADVRWPAVMAILPDLIDKPIAILFPALVHENTRSFGHTLLANAALLAVLLLFRRTKRPILLWLCFTGHLFLDRMWLNSNPIILFWPFLGRFPPGVHGALNSRLIKWNVYGELLGLLLILNLARRYRLYEPERFGAFLRTGRLVAA